MKVVWISGALLQLLVSGVFSDTAAQQPEQPGAVSPALELHTSTTFRELWRRPDLSPRDRSIVTVSALIARNQTVEMRSEFERALDNGVQPGEVSEIITHLAFYAGRGNAMAAAAIVEGVFNDRDVGVNQLPAASGSLLPPRSDDHGAYRCHQSFAR